MMSNFVQQVLTSYLLYVNLCTTSLLMRNAYSIDAQQVVLLRSTVYTYIYGHVKSCSRRHKTYIFFFRSAGIYYIILYVNACTTT